MKDLAAGIGILIVFLAFIFGLAWLVQGQDFFLYKFWAPKYEQVRRETYEQTKSFKKGSADRLSALCGQVAAAGDGQKSMLNQQIAQEFSDMNTSDAPDYLQGCLATARQ